MTGTEQEKLAVWTFKYIGDKVYERTHVTFEGYKELAITDGFRMGYCECSWAETLNGYKWLRGKIWLDDDHAKCPKFFRDATLWHEFCHVWDACEQLHVDHCGNFQLKKLRKPWYALGDVVLKLIGWVWFD